MVKMTNNEKHLEIENVTAEPKKPDAVKENESSKKSNPSEETGYSGAEYYYNFLPEFSKKDFNLQILQDLGYSPDRTEKLLKVKITAPSNSVNADTPMIMSMSDTSIHTIKSENSDDDDIRYGLHFCIGGIDHILDSNYSQDNIIVIVSVSKVTIEDLEYMKKHNCLFIQKLYKREKILEWDPIHKIYTNFGDATEEKRDNDDDDWDYYDEVTEKETDVLRYDDLIKILKLSNNLKRIKVIESKPDDP